MSVGECLNIIVDLFIFFRLSCTRLPAEEKMMSGYMIAIKKETIFIDDTTEAGVEHGNKARLALKPKNETQKN